MTRQIVRVVSSLAMGSVLMAASLCLPLHAAGQNTVTVKSTRDPVDKSYRDRKSVV